ncbi:universal stress protein [Maliponia aquimaris]|uniref:Universal stress protein UspE n=1 Tax=Maliponia aquimaris TaxID=1673631 RepID=A0A238L114_9RHOB|nr:universal stress protein [Maliponia aquimaris]SMX48784.1 universal stress protein UspE [Maliponia aquimaris]
MNPIRILAAVDRFPEDDAVLLRGMEIAAHHGVALSIVHIVDLPDHAAGAALNDPARGQAVFAARDRIEAALRRHEIDPADTDIRIEAGSPAQRLVEICDLLKPTLVVMRAHHKSGIIEKLLGSTTDKVIAAGIAPVLVVRQDIDKPYRRVLLAIDGPDNAPAALSFVAALLPNAALHLVQAVQMAHQLEEAMLRVGLAQSDLSAHHDVLAKDAENRLRSLVAGLVPPVTWQVLRGEPAAELVRATHSPEVDLIALGPNRSSLIRRAFVGSVARRLLRDCACDVLISRPVEERRPETVERAERADEQPTPNLKQLSI